MKKFIFPLMYFIGLSLSSLSAESIKMQDENSKTKTNVQGVFSDEVWQRIIQNSTKPEKLKPKEIDEKNDIIYLEKPKGHKKKLTKKRKRANS